MKKKNEEKIEKKKLDIAKECEIRETKRIEPKQSSEKIKKELTTSKRGTRLDTDKNTAGCDKNTPCK